MWLTNANLTGWLVKYHIWYPWSWTPAFSHVGFWNESSDCMTPMLVFWSICLCFCFHKIYDDEYDASMLLMIASSWWCLSKIACKSVTEQPNPKWNLQYFIWPFYMITSSLRHLCHQYTSVGTKSIHLKKKNWICCIQKPQIILNFLQNDCLKAQELMINTLLSESVIVKISQIFWDQKAESTTFF